MAATAPRRASALAAPNLTSAALVVALGFLGSRLLGLLRSVIIADRFGTSPELDAYFVAFRLPDLVFQLLAGATLASAFIPTFARVHAREGGEAAWRMASSVLNIVLIATLVFALIAFALAPRIVPAIAPGLGEDSGREAELRSLAVDLTRLMLLSPVFFAVSGMFMGILNARRHFLTPALAPMLYNLGIIVAALVAHDVKVLSAGVVVGAGLHLLVQLPDLRVAGMSYSFAARWKDAAVREVGALMAPRVLGLAAAQVNFYFVAIYFASRVSDGAISAVTFAWLIVMTPLGVVGMAISTAVFPTLADQAASADREELARTLARSLRFILFLALPAGVGLMIVARPTVVVLLQHGAFGNASTDPTVDAVVFYALGLFAHNGIEILSRGYYALSDTRTPVAFALVSMLVNIGLAAALVGPMEVRGLALALSLASIAEFLLLYALIRARLPFVASTKVLGGLARLVVATGVMALAAGGLLLLLGGAAGFDLDRGRDAAAALVLCIGAGAGAYFVAALVLGCDELYMLTARVPWLLHLLALPLRGRRPAASP